MREQTVGAPDSVGDREGWQCLRALLQHRLAAVPSRVAAVCRTAGVDNAQVFSSEAETTQRLLTRQWHAARCLYEETKTGKMLSLPYLIFPSSNTLPKSFQLPAAFSLLLTVG